MSYFVGPEPTLHPHAGGSACSTWSSAAARTQRLPARHGVAAYDAWHQGCELDLGLGGVSRLNGNSVLVYVHGHFAAGVHVRFGRAILHRRSGVPDAGLHRQRPHHRRDPRVHASQDLRSALSRDPIVLRVAHQLADVWRKPRRTQPLVAELDYLEIKAPPARRNGPAGGAGAPSSAASTPGEQYQGAPAPRTPGTRSNLDGHTVALAAPAGRRGSSGTVGSRASTPDQVRTNATSAGPISRWGERRGPTGMHDPAQPVHAHPDEAPTWGSRGRGSNPVSPTDRALICFRRSGPVFIVDRSTMKGPLTARSQRARRPPGQVAAVRARRRGIIERGSPSDRCEADPRGPRPP